MMTSLKISRKEVRVCGAYQGLKYRFGAVHKLLDPFELTCPAQSLIRDFVDL